MASVLTRTARGGAGFIAANVVNKGAALVFVFIATRLLDAGAFGMLALSMAVLAVVHNLALFGLPLAAQRYLSGTDNQDAAGLYGAILACGLALAAAAAALFYLLAPLVADRVFAMPELAPPLRALSAGVLVAVCYGLGRAILQSQERVDRIIAMDTVQKVGQIGSALVLFWMVPDVTAFAWAINVGYGMACVAGLLFVLRLPLRPSFSALRPSMRTIVGYAAPTVLVSFSYMLSQQTDRLMLGALSTAEAVGIYTVATSLAMVIGALHASLVAVFMPIASEAFRRNAMDDVQQAFSFISKWMGGAGGALLILYVGAGAPILAFFGAEHSGAVSYYVLLLLASLYFIGTWTGPTGALLLMADGQRAEVFNTVLFIVSNIVLNLLLIPYAGVLGAAAATMISTLVRKAIQVAEIARWYRLSPFDRFSAPILLIVTTAVAVGLALQGHPALQPLASLVGIGVLAGYLLWTTAPEERRMLLKLRTKFATRAR